MWQSTVNQRRWTAAILKPIKVSPTLVQKASDVMPGEKKFYVAPTRLPLADKIEEKNDGGGSHGNALFEDMASIGLHAMQRANSVVEDFCRLYFVFHGMDVTRPECVFKYLPVLSFTESYIYQLDNLNEKIVGAKKIKASVPNGFNRRSHEEAYSTWFSSFIETFEIDPFRQLSLLLEQHGLLTDRIQLEFQHGVKYWALERKLCGAPEHAEISLEDVITANRLRSSDYRILNLLLYQMQGKEVDDLHMEFLTAREFLGEIADDILDYEEDVLDNTFNILRMFVRIYGASAAPNMLARCIAEAEDKYVELSKALDPELYKRCQRRCEEASNKGGKIAGYPLGSWIIPPVIVDEKLYRSTLETRQ